MSGGSHGPAGDSVPRVGFAYDDRVIRHTHPTDPSHPENPERVTKPFQMLKDSGLLDQCVMLPNREATVEELTLVHSPEFIAKVASYTSQSAASDEVCRIPETWPTYVSPAVFEAATCAAGAALCVVDAILSNKIDSGVALIRPPGHHAEKDESCGFCFFNNVALAARYAQQKYNVQKVLIIDWDIHHGNGIQHIFYEDSSVLYLSAHRYDNGEYFPHLKEASVESVGRGKGEGFNINIAWNKDKMGDSDYKAAFDRVILPIANQFKPDLILLACGFDAAAADPLGEYVLSDNMYGYMVSKLCGIAGGRIGLMLEGGYNPTAIGQGMIASVRALLGGNTPILTVSEPCKRAQQTLQAVVETHSKYWNFSSPQV